MVLYLIGLGLDWLDLSQKALAILSKCDKIYLETYTSLSTYSVDKLARYLGKKVIPLDRKGVEETKPFVKEASMKDIALLVYGDPLTATTHIELLSTCKKKKIRVEVIHAPSVFTAVAETGLQIYKFGKTASIPFWEKNHRPESFFDILESNLQANSHTLFLLDLRPPNKYLSIKEAINMLLTIAKQRRGVVIKQAIGCARLGTKSAKIVYGTPSKVAKASYGNPPYCLIVPAKLHFAEEEFLKAKHIKQ